MLRNNEIQVLITRNDMFHIMMIHKLSHDYVFQSMLDLENCVNRMKERCNGNLFGDKISFH
jgi:hypothetical protein